MDGVLETTAIPGCASTSCCPGRTMMGSEPTLGWTICPGGGTRILGSPAKGATGTTAGTSLSGIGRAPGLGGGWYVCWLGVELPESGPVYDGGITIVPPRSGTGRGEPDSNDGGEGIAISSSPGTPPTYPVPVGSIWRYSSYGVPPGRTGPPGPTYCPGSGIPIGHPRGGSGMTGL